MVMPAQTGLEQLWTLMQQGDNPTDPMVGLNEPQAPGLTLENLISEPEPLTGKQKALGSIGDLMQNFVNIKYGRPTAESSVQRMLAENRQRALEQTRQNFANAQLQMGKDRFDRTMSERERDREDARAQQAQARIDFFNARDYDEKRDADQYRTGLLDSAAKRGIKVGEDATESDIRSLIAESVYRENQKKFGDVGAEARMSREVEANSAGRDFLSDFILGNPENNMPSLSDRMSEGQTGEDIYDRFQLQIGALPLSDEDREDILREVRKRIASTWRSLNPEKKTRQPEVRSAFDESPAGAVINTTGSLLGGILGLPGAVIDTEAHRQQRQERRRKIDENYPGVRLPSF